MAADGYEWDPAKAAANFRKHGVRFSDAATALGDPMCVTIADPDTNGKPRWVSIGTDGHGRIIVTAFTQRGGLVRLISSRRATALERRRYQER